MNLPTGTSVLVSVLDEKREQLRNEGLLLLLRLVKDHQEIQKRVAFENAFEKVFAILQEEGGLEGGIVTADSFKLLHNLLAGNTSNQNWFRETEFFRSITALIEDINKDSNFSAVLNQNIIALLEIVRLFVRQDSKDKITNQNWFLKCGLVTHLVGLAFAEQVPRDIRAESLVTLAELVHSNQDLQQYFLKASSMARNPLNIVQGDLYDVSALLDILLEDDEEAFDMRYAASLCVQSFGFGSHERRTKIIDNIINAFMTSKAGNLLDGVLKLGSEENQFRLWFSCNTLLHLTHEDEDTRSKLTTLMIGDADNGEEEVSLIQTISANLVRALQNDKARSASAYMMLLSSWLFESSDNVADFLEESSTLQTLIGSLLAVSSNEIIRGLCAALLSICYAFDFAEQTPVDRASLQNILLRIGRDVIAKALVNFSRCDAFRARESTGPVFERPILDQIYIDFFLDNYGVIRKAVDQPVSPVRSKREAEAQEEQERAEDIIAELETELERKSGGLEEAIAIIKTRQEELQRVRDEVTYMTQKYKVELSSIEAELQKERHECSHLRTEATKASNDIDKSLHENSVLHGLLEKAQEETDKIRQQYKAANEQLIVLHDQVDSEASKRSFLENELKSLRSASTIASEQLESLRAEFEQAVDKLSLVTDEADVAKAQLVQVSAELKEARNLQKNAEADVVSHRTRARDLDTESKGFQQQLEADAQAFKKECEQSEIAISELRESLAQVRHELDVAKAELVKSHADHDAKYAELERIKAAEIAELQKRHEEFTEKSKQIIPEETSTKDKITNGSTKSTSDESLLKRIRVLENENAELQKQLEQAQEDLVLFMEDAGEAG